MQGFHPTVNDALEHDVEVEGLESGGLEFERRKLGEWVEVEVVDYDGYVFLKNNNLEVCIGG